MAASSKPDSPKQMDVPMEDESATPVVETTETDGTQVESSTPPVTDAQWRAMKAIPDMLTSHRKPE